jgi:hypothetical protein
MGLRFPPVLAFSVLGGLVAATATYYGFGRRLSPDERPLDETLPHGVAGSAKGLLEVINQAGAEAFRIACAGFLIHPLDLPGVAILISAGRRVASLWKPAVLGACMGILVRTLGHVLIGWPADQRVSAPADTTSLAG